MLGGLGYSVEWRPGDLLHYWYTMPSIRYTVPSWYWYTILSWYWYTRLRRHPASGEMVWCNQASVSHGSYYTSLPDAEALGYTDQVMRVMIIVMMMMMMMLAGDCSLPHWPH